MTHDAWKDPTQHTKMQTDEHARPWNTMLAGFHKFVLSIVRAHASHDAAAANLAYEYTKFSICVDLVPVPWYSCMYTRVLKNFEGIRAGARAMRFNKFAMREAS